LSTITSRWPVLVAGLVAHVGDPADPAVLGQLVDLDRDVLRVDLVGQLGDDQLGAPAGVLLDLDHRAHGDRAAAGPVRVLDATAAHDQAVGGKSGPLIR
jgi:hypothetical protein